MNVAAQCKLCSECTCEHVTCGRCIFLHSRRFQGIWDFRQAKNDNLNKNIFKVTVQSRLKIGKNPNFDSTSNRRAAPSAVTKTKLLVCLKGKFSVQFEDQLCNCTHQDPRVVDHDVWFAVQDGLDYFLHQFFQRVRCTVLCISASLHENQGVAWLVLESPLCSEKCSRNSCIDFVLQV